MDHLRPMETTEIRPMETRSASAAREIDAARHEHAAAQLAASLSGLGLKRKAAPPPGCPACEQNKRRGTMLNSETVPLTCSQCAQRARSTSRHQDGPGESAELTLGADDVEMAAIESPSRPRALRSQRRLEEDEDDGYEGEDEGMGGTVRWEYRSRYSE